MRFKTKKGMIAFGLAVVAVGVCCPGAHAIEQMPPQYDARIFRVTPQDGDPTAKATACVRELKAKNGGKLPQGGVIVEFEDGTYPLARTWTLGAADSGAPECPVRFRAAHPGKAIFTGARRIGWQRLDEAKGLPASAGLLPAAVRGHVLTAVLPDGEPAPGFACASRYQQDELLVRPEYEYALALYQDDRRVENARWPNAGFARISQLTGEIREAWIFRNSKSVTFGAEGPDGARPNLAAWAKEPDLYLHGAWRYEYTDSTSRPASIDAAQGLVTLSAPWAQHGTTLGAEFQAVNAVSELDAPGEWALDVKARRLYVRPFEGGELPRLARTKTLLDCRGVNDVTFEGFVFEAARGHAVRFADCRDVTLERSVVRHTTGWGVYVERGRGCRVEGCDLYDLGEGGVWLEGGAVDTLTPSRHVCDNCRIQDYALLAWNYNPGVRLFGCGNEATHNLIYNAPQQACFFYGAENRFAWNVVHDVCRHSDDAGAIYSYNTVNAWANRGNVIEYNVFHRIAPHRPRYCQLNAIYLDAFTSGSVVRGNITSESSLGVFSSGGQDNLIERNLIVHARNGAVRRWNLGRMGGKNAFRHTIMLQTDDGLRQMTNHSDRVSYLMKPLYDKGELYRMPFWKDRFPNMMGILDFDDPVLGHSSHHCTIRDNVSADAAGVIVIDPEVTKGTTAVGGNAVLAGDPGFVDHLGLDWELKPDAPARKTLGGGTRFGEMGLYASAKRITPPVRWGPDVTRPQPFNPNAGKGTWATWCPSDGDIRAFIRRAIADGVANVRVSGLKAEPYAPATDVCEALAAMECFAWDFADGSGRPFAAVKAGIVDLCMMYPKLKQVIVDGLSDAERAELAQGVSAAPQKVQVKETAEREDSPAECQDTLAYARDEAVRLLARAGVSAKVSPSDDPPGLSVVPEGASAPDWPSVSDVRFDGYAVRIRNGAYAIAAKEKKGVLNGVYALFERLGFAFVEPGEDGERVPSALSRLPDGDWTESPRFRYRGIFAGSSPVRFTVRERYAFYAKIRFNALTLHGDTTKVPEDAFAKTLGLRLETGAHGMSACLPRELFETNPELFRMFQPEDFGGKRMKDSNFCPTNPKSRETAKANYLRQAGQAARRGYHAFHAWADDLPAGGWCMCSRCRALLATDQSQHVMNLEAQAVREAGLDLRVPVLAYHDTMFPSETIDPDPLCYYLFAPRERCYAHALNDPSCRLNRHYLGALAAWTARYRGIDDSHTFEYYNDKILFRSHTPYLPDVILGDGDAYEAAGIENWMSLQVGGDPLAPDWNMLAHALVAWERGLTREALTRRLATAAGGSASRAWYEYLSRRATAYEKAWQVCDVPVGVYFDYRFMPERPSAAGGAAMTDNLRLGHEELVRANDGLTNAKDLDPFAKALAERELRRSRFEAKDLAAMTLHQRGLTAIADSWNGGGEESVVRALGDLKRTVGLLEEANALHAVAAKGFEKNQYYDLFATAWSIPEIRNKIRIYETVAKPLLHGEARTPPLRRCGVSPHQNGGFATSSYSKPED